MRSVLWTSRCWWRSAPSTASLGDVPPSVHLERFVDQAAVLRSVDLVVHHGGSGTMLGAAAHGRPQLVLPLGADQFYNGEQISSTTEKR